MANEQGRSGQQAKSEERKVRDRSLQEESSSYEAADSALSPDALPHHHTAAQLRQASARQIQRVQGNHHFQASRVGRSGGAGSPRVQRSPPNATVTNTPDGNSSVSFSPTTITANGRYDAETEREMNIGRGSTQAYNQGVTYITQHYVKMMDAVNVFKVSAQSQIDAMEGDPSDCWGMIPTLVGTVAGVVGTVFPPLAIGAAIVAGLQALGQTAVTAGVKDARANAKQDAKNAMNAFATTMGNGQARILNSVQSPLSQRLLTLSVTDDSARALLEVPSPEGLDNVLLMVGVPNPTQTSPYGPILEALEVQFSQWLARQRATSGMTGFHRLLSEIPGTEDYREVQPQVDAAGEAARERARNSARERREPGAQ